MWFRNPKKQAGWHIWGRVLQELWADGTSLPSCKGWGGPTSAAFTPICLLHSSCVLVPYHEMVTVVRLACSLVIVHISSFHA